MTATACPTVCALPALFPSRRREGTRESYGPSCGVKLWCSTLSSIAPMTSKLVFGAPFGSMSCMLFAPSVINELTSVIIVSKISIEVICRRVVCCVCKNWHRSDSALLTFGCPMTSSVGDVLLLVLDLCLMSASDSHLWIPCLHAFLTAILCEMPVASLLCCVKVRSLRNKFSANKLW